jgi:hypothetical protein
VTYKGLEDLDLGLEPSPVRDLLTRNRLAGSFLAGVSVDAHCNIPVAAFPDGLQYDKVTSSYLLLALIHLVYRKLVLDDHRLLLNQEGRNGLLKIGH